MFSICGFYGMEMGLTKWNKDILKPEHDGKVIEMLLKERRFFMTKMRLIIEIRHHLKPKFSLYFVFYK